MRRFRRVVMALVVAASCVLVVGIALPDAAIGAVPEGADVGTSPSITLTIDEHGLYPGAQTSVNGTYLPVGEYELESNVLSIQSPDVVISYPYETANTWQASVPSDATPGQSVTVWLVAVTDPSTHLADASTTVSGPSLYSVNISPGTR